MKVERLPVKQILSGIELTLLPLIQFAAKIAQFRSARCSKAISQTVRVGASSTAHCRKR